MKIPSSIDCDRSQRDRIAQWLAAAGVFLGGNVFAQETQLAFHTEDPDGQVRQVRTVSDESDYFLSYQVNAQQGDDPHNSDRYDSAIPSSSDLLVPDRHAEFLALEPPQEATLSDQVDSTEQTTDSGLGDQPDRPLELPPAKTPISRSACGTMAAAFSSTPTMMGDFFGGSILGGSYGDSTISLAGADRRFKIAENVSPIPQDRVFLNYNHFHNSLRDVQGIDRSLDRFTFGFEKTVLDGLASLEVRLPFAVGLDSRQDALIPNSRATELGNLALAFKADLLSGDDWILAAGTSMTLPTGDDYELSFGDTYNYGTLRVNNDAVHLAPFLGYLTRVGCQSFLQGFVQADFDLNGNDVLGNQSGYEGVLQDQNLLFADLAFGHWLHRSRNRCDCLSGVAALGELHYTTTLNDTDTVGGLTNPSNRMDVLNATGAVHFLFGKTSLRLGGSAPLRSDEEKLFDAAIILQLNRNF